MKIDNSRDELFSKMGKATLQDRYLLPNETYQGMFKRVSQAFSDNKEHAQRLYDYMSKHWFMPATPILANGGTTRGQSISCFLQNSDDSMADIIENWRETSYLAASGGGIGVYYGNIRPMGDSVGRDGGKTSGVVPFIRVQDSLTLAISQGNLRRGSAAVYLPIWHAEIEEFVEIRKPTGGDSNRKALNVHHGVVIDDKFMQAVESNDDYDLTSSSTGDVIKTVKARALWEKLLLMRVETGEPYILWVDRLKEATPAHHKVLGLEPVQSNLCVAPETKILTKQGYKKIADLKGKKVDCWNGEGWSNVQIKKTGTNQSLIEVFIEVNGEQRVVHCTPYHKFYVKTTDGYTNCIEAQNLVKLDKLESWSAPDGSEFNAIILDVKNNERIDDTYCATEPKRNRLCFNGIVTGNCSEITLPTNTERTAVCCLSSLNVEHYDTWKDNELFVDDIMRFLDNVLQDFIDTAPPVMQKAINSARNERSVGLGAMGFHSYLQSKNIAIDSAIAKSHNMRIFKHIKEKVDLSNVSIAEEKGACPDAVKNGDNLRFSYTMAIAPNASISTITGSTSPGIEPFNSNIYSHKTLSGTFTIKNKHLRKLIADKYPEQEDEVWSDIISSEGGSIQDLKWFTKEEKEVFKTAFELDQRWLIEHAADRQPYIDQAQSLNIFLPANVDKKTLIKLHMEAWKKGLKSLYYLRSLSSQRAERLKIMSSNEDECLSCN